MRRRKLPALQRFTCSSGDFTARVRRLPASTAHPADERLTPGCGDAESRRTAQLTMRAGISFVDGAREKGDPWKIPLSDRKEIQSMIGSPPATIPSEFPG